MYVKTNKNFVTIILLFDIYFKNNLKKKYKVMVLF